MSGFDTRRLVTDICSQERQYSWQLMNRRIALKELAISGAEFNPSIRDRNKLGLLRDMIFGNRWLVNEMLELPGFRHRRLAAGAGGENERPARR